MNPVDSNQNDLPLPFIGGTPDTGDFAHYQNAYTDMYSNPQPTIVRNSLWISSFTTYFEDNDAEEKGLSDARNLRNNG